MFGGSSNGIGCGGLATGLQKAFICHQNDTSTPEFNNNSYQ
jgi:hypothetical protein